MRQRAPKKDKKRQAKIQLALGDELRKITNSPVGSTLPVIKQIEKFLKEEFSVMTNPEHLKAAARRKHEANFLRSLWGKPAKFGNISVDQHFEHEQLVAEVRELHIFKKLARFCTVKKLDLGFSVDYFYTSIKITISW